MADPIFTTAADRDLVRIARQIARRNPAAAVRTVRAVRDRAAFYVNFPDLGERRDDLMPGLRLFVVGRYVVFYRFAIGTLYIVRVIHSARDVDRIMRRHRRP